MMRSKLFLIIAFFFFYNSSWAQCPLAIPVDLSANSSAVFSQSFSTIGPLATNCCPAYSSDGDRCIKFSITLNPAAMGVRFEMSPTPSPGVFRIGCGSTASNVGSFTCLSGPGPHVLTFCNPNQITKLFKIISVPKPSAGPDIYISQGCSKIINATGFDQSGVIWKSVPNNSTYNAYLSCTNCLTPTIIPGSSLPAYVDYQVCGTPSTAGCGATLCDTVRVFFTPPLSVTISPTAPAICNGQTPNSTSISANGSGGSGSYTYLWNNINVSQNITVPSGLYTVVLSDGSGCNATASVQVIKYSVPVSANAGLDQTVCYQSPTATLNGSVAGANGGIWSGAGVFSPNTSTLAATYTPTPLELTLGFADLTLTTTGNGACAPATDIVRIYYGNFTGVVGVSATLVTCHGASDGILTVNVVGGVSPHTFSWNTSPAQTTAAASGLSLGNYTVTITNGIGCTSTSSATVIQPPPIALAPAITNVTCAGGSNGAISVAASGGTGPYSYLWQPGNQTTTAINNKTAGTYTLTATDSKGCQKVSTYTITQPPPIAIALTPTPVGCFGGNTGSASSLVSGGTAPYSYSWSSGASAPNASALAAGTYTLNVTDNVGCLVANTVIITQPSSAATNVTVTHETCNYLNNGTATAAPSGGTPGYTYLWQPGAFTSSSISNLASGTYTLTTTDSKGCTITSFPTITEPAPLTINFISQNNVSCFGGNNGLVTASPAGGTPNYTYLWTAGGGTTANRNNLQAGTYTVTTTDSKGCTATNSVTITEPLAPLALSPTITDVTCNGGNNGAIALTPSGGTSPYVYLWQPGNVTSQQISGLAAGTYSVTVKDAKLCPITSTYTVNQPASATLSITPTHLSCFNGNDGAASASISGGTAPYSYSWLPGAATTANISNLQAGTYSLTVLDFKGCSKTNSVIITQPSMMVLNPTINPIVCSGGSNGSIALAPTGGTPPYSYLWSQGSQTASSITNLSLGTYAVTVTDSKGCQIIANYTIVQLSLTVALTPTPVTCFGGNNGSISALPSGGTPNFTYLWQPGSASTNAISNLIAGTYTLSVTDLKGCVTTNSVVITQPNAVSASTTITNETCNYLNNGTATAVPSGGTPGYTYLWQPALQTTGTISNVSAGTYTLTVTDLNGCTAITSAIITQPLPLAIAISGQTNVSTCFGDNNGAVTATASGGTPGYIYTWMPGSANTNAISNLTAGTYTLTLLDLNGCSITKPVVITQPTAVSASTTKTNETCSYLNNGTAAAVALGGSPPYTYLWSNGATTAMITNLSSQTYTVVVTDFKGCTANATATVSEPPVLGANFGQINVSCMGGSNGSATATAVGGTPNYTYSWTPGGTTSATKNNLQAGTYTVTITDGKGCTATNSVVITEPAALLANITINNETCSNLNNGTATAIATGGTAGYTYLWKPGLQTTGTISNLQAATYTLIVTDLKGCTATNNFTITDPPVLAINFTGQTNVSTCFGASNGSVTGTPAGGTPAYTYSWAPGSATTAAVSNLTAGTYTLTVQDNLGCTLSKTIVITQPTLLSTSLLNTNETCNNLDNGASTAVATGGTPGPGYTYLWQPGSQTTNAISGLASGTYTVTATDSKGCTSTSQAIITQPAVLAVNFSGQINVSCFGGNNGTVISTPSGGTPNYTYSWAPGGATTANRNNLTAGTHTLTITDSKGCTATNTVVITQPPVLSASTTNTSATCSYSTDGTATALPAGGSPGYTYSWQPGLQTTVTKTGLSAGSYTVTVKDSKGCAVTAIVVITATPLLAINFTSQINVSCKGGSNGSVTASPTGGTAGYTYLWSPGGATTNSRSGLAAGTYSVKVTDSKGCTAIKPVVITEPNTLIVSTSKTPVSCKAGANGTATAIISGGTAAYTYLWQPGALTTAGIINLPAGTYSLTCTDSKGCVATSTAIITEPAVPLTVSFQNQTNVSCFGGSNGAVAAIGSGGTSSYTYSWLPGGATTNAVFGLTAGTKTVTITDAKGCTATNSVVITQPAALVVAATTVSPTCYLAANGSITASATGGTAPYTYKWTTPIPTNILGPTISNTRAGTYTVTVTDAKGCTTTNSFTILEPLPITIAVTIVNSACTLPTGSVSASVTNGTSPYSYLWSTGGTNSSISNLFANVYSVTVTDFNGCKSFRYVNVIDDLAAIATNSLTMPNCYGGANGSATVNTVGGTPPFSYLWLPSGGTNATANGLSTGTYTVKVTDSNGCQSSDTDVLSQPTRVLLNVTKNNNVSCFGGSNGKASATAVGGTPAYTYLWLPGGATASIMTNSAGTYTVEVTDSKGCKKDTAVTLLQPAAVSVSISAFTHVSCFGGNDGSASATSATGGNGGAFQYSWMPGNINGINASNLIASTYTITVKDYKGCTGTASTTITQPTLLTQNFINKKNVTCYGGSDGAVATNPSGGTPGYTYFWKPGGASTATISNLPAGVDTIIITDLKGCILKNFTTITQPTLLAASTLKTNTTCNYLNNGTASAVHTGGTPPYTYLWQPGGFTTAAISNLSIGTYSVTVTDSIGCSSNATAVIDEPAQLGITFSTHKNVSCFGGSDGSISAVPSGGTLNYNYSWTPGAATTSTISNLSIGTYTVTVTDSNNCLAQNSITLNQPPAALTNSLSYTPVSCYSGSDGSISALTSGGTASYNYSFLPGNLNGDNPKNLSAGTYTVTITDTKGCSMVDSITVTQASPMVLIQDSINSNCSFANGKASISVSGGTGSYLYKWLPSGGTNSIATGLLSGTYTVSVTDSNGCIVKKGTTVNDNPGPAATIYATTNVSCAGGTNGTASATVSGTSGPFTYSWLPLGGTDSLATGLSIGTYTLIVTDANLCQSVPVISPEITEPDPIFIIVNTTALNCYGGTDGSATAIASGGTPGYSYQWLPGGTTGTSILNLSANTYSIQVTDAKSCVNTIPYTIAGPTTFVSDSLSYTSVSCFAGADGSVTSTAAGGTPPYDYNWMPGNYNAQTLFNLTAGSYTVTVIDANGCSIIDSIKLTQPTPLVLSASGINAKCDLPNGQSSVSVTGGIAPYGYQWSNAGETTAAITDLLPGTYTVYVTDSNACPASTFVTVIPNPSPIATITATTNVRCFGGFDGTASVAVSGSAAGPFIYSWLPSGGNSSTATGLAAGTYTVTITDANSCQSLPEVSPEITEPPPIYITISSTSASCYGASNGGATAIPSGGTPAYTYLWLPGSTTGASFTNLSASTYTIQVTDTNSCVNNTPFTIAGPTLALSVSSSFVPVSCFAGADGSVSIAAAGGSAPYSYSWMPGNLIGQNQANLPAGTYTVSVIDSKGCSLTDSVIVTQPALIVLTPSSVNSNCSMANGQASVTVSGGASPYLYQWSPVGGTNSTATGLLYGTYSVLVTDNNLCTSTVSVTVSDTPRPTVTITSTTNVSCNGASNGAAFATASGTSGPFTYSWMPSGGNDSAAIGLLPGTYTVTAMDIYSCQSAPAISPLITEPALISIVVTASTMSCFGGSNETASAIASGGNPGYSYKWLPSGTLGTTISNLSANTYTIEVTDASSCLQTEIFTVTEPSQLTAAISSTVNVSCFGGNNGAATVIASGGTPVYSYNWSPNGGNGSTGAVLSEGTYTITISDLNGCIIVDSVTITQPAQPLSATSTKSSITCFGLADGTAKIIPVGGTPGFSYQWTPSISTSDTASGLSAGNYNVTVTDTNSCQTHLSVSILQPAVLGGSLAFINPSCNLTNGSITPQLSGGTYPYTFLWTPGNSTTSGINGLAQGTYSVQITDALNCSLALTTTLTDIPLPVLAVSAINNVSCYGGDNGSATINIMQGTAPYAINWSPSGGNNLIATSLTSGTFTVTAIDADGCEISDTLVVTEPTAIDLSNISVTDVLCNGGNTGTISVTPTGGIGPIYTYSWAPVSSSSSAAVNLAIGTYTVNVMDQNNCIAAVSVNIAQPPALSSTIDSVKNPTCYNGFGGASAFASGGILPYSYLWSPSADTLSTANSLTADSYTVTVTDANGCNTSSNVLLTQPSQVVTSAGPNDTICLGQSGSLSATATGGVGNYFYAWQPSGAITSGTLPITPSGDITFTIVAYDLAGCPGTPTLASAIVYNLDSLSVQAYATSPICPGQSAVVYVETLGTTGELTYQWNNNVGNGPGAYLVNPSQPTAYSITVSNACNSVSDTVKILFNPPPAIYLTSDTNALCVPGTIQFFDNSVTGNPNDPITQWYWSFSDGTTSTAEDPGHTYSVPSDYPVTLVVTTSGGCTNNNTATPLVINGHPFPVASFSLSSTELELPYDVLLCSNQSTGAISYNWNFGNGETSAVKNPQHVYTAIGIFQVQLVAMTQFGCLDTAYSEVTTNAEVTFPNAFSPNADGSSGGFFDITSLDNDIFFAYTAGVTEYELEIYNRWGEIIFATQDPKQGWDGYYKNELCQQDVYIWRAFVKLNNGKAYYKNGNLTLLR